MVKLILRKMLKNKWLILSLITGCMLAVAVVGSIPMYTDGILQRMLIKDFERFQEEKSIYPTFNKFEGRFSNINDAENRKTLYDYYNANIEQKMAVNVPMDIIVSYRSVSTSNRIFLDYREWPQLLKEIQENKMFKSVRTGRANVFAVDKLPEMVEVINGEMYTPGRVRVETEDFSGDVYEVVITSETMQRNGYSMGGIYTLTINKEEEDYILNYKIVGVVELKEEMTPFMYMDNYGIYFDYDTYLNYVLNERDMSISECQWYYAYDFYQFKMSEAQNVLDSLDDNYEWIADNYGRLGQANSFETTLEEYLERANKLSGLLLLLVIPVILMIGFYVSMIAQLIMEQEKNEIAMLESRGASRWQIFKIYMGESIIIGVIAYILGIFGAYFMCRMIGASNGFMEFVNRSALETSIGGKTLLYGFVCVLLFVITMLIPAFRASKFTIVQFKQGKAVFSRKSFWEKAYLDVILLVVASYALFNYNKFKDVISYAEGGKVDYLVFFAVTFFILGVSLVFMRIYPFIINGIFKIGKRWWTPSMYAAFTYVARGGNMRQFIMIFLILALGVGIFNANSARTINENTTDKIRYEKGTEIILNIGDLGFSEDGDIIDLSNSFENQQTYEKIRQYDGISMITQVSTQTVDVGAVGRRTVKTRDVKLMAITPEEFGEVIWFRSDLDKFHINHYLNLLARFPEGIIITTKMAENMEVLPGDIMYVIISEKEIQVPLLATVDYWPTYNRFAKTGDKGEEQELCIMHYDTLKASIGEFKSSVWLAKKDGVLDSEFNNYLVENNIELLNAIYTDYEISEAKKDPMLHGMNGMLTLDFLVTMIICGAGFIIFWILSIRQRVLQFGIFRAMGLKKSELISMIIWEQLLISAVAIIVGIVIGGITSELFVPLFQIVDTNTERIIPFATFYERKDYIVIYTIVVVMLIVGVGSIARFITRIKMDQAVKLGED